MFIRFWNWLVKEPEARVCSTCVVYRQELEYSRHQNNQLLNTIIEISRPKPVVQYEQTEIPVSLPNTRFANFAEKRKQLEAQSQIEANRLAQLKKDTSSGDKVEGVMELEEMIGIGGTK